MNERTGDPLHDPHGKPLKPLKLGGSLGGVKAALAPGGPVVINQDLFVGSQDGKVYRVALPQWLGKAR